jgi:multidrug resistance efflux pump
LFLAVIALICWMWIDYVPTSAIVGEVETIHAPVVATVAGTLQELKIDRLQPVTNGQVLAILTPLDADQLRAEIAAAEADLRLLKGRMDIDKTRNTLSYSQLRVAWMEEQLNLDVARIHLQQAQNEFTRAQKLLDSQLISRGVGGGLSGGGLLTPKTDFGYEVAQRDRDAFQSEVATREKAVAGMEKDLNDVEKTGVVEVDPVDADVERDIASQRERIRQLQKPLVLRSPIDGFVSEITCRAGLNVAAGGTILVVSGGRTDRIVAWMHPPISERPQIGDTVELRRVGFGQSSFEGTIVEVGTQLEPVSPTLRNPGADPASIELGLPMLVRATAVLDLIPGEPVQVRSVRSTWKARPN